MEFDRDPYAARGVPRISQNFAEAFIAAKHPKIEIISSESLDEENPYLRLVLDYRSLEVNRNLPKKIRRKSPKEIVSMAEREFRLRASIAYQGLVYAAEERALLSEDSGLPLLTKEMGEDFEKFYYNTRRLSKRSDEFLEFLREKDAALFDLVSLMSSDYEGQMPILLRDLATRNIQRVRGFINSRGNLGVETLYDALRRYNQTLKLESQFRL